MSVVAISQGLKYSIGWLIAECTCILIGLGGYPSSCNAIPGQGPCCKPSEKEETFVALFFCCYSKYKKNDECEILLAPFLRKSFIVEASRNEHHKS